MLCKGGTKIITTSEKINYLNSLLNIGFEVLDFGSFVSAKAIPQMADTKEVLASLKLENCKTKLLAIVANVRGAEEAIQYDAISYIGYPFSISPTFQMRNTNCTIEESLITVAKMQNLCIAQQKELVIYLSMAFGNPYGDIYNESLLLHYANIIQEMGIKNYFVSRYSWCS